MVARTRGTRAASRARSPPPRSPESARRSSRWFPATSGAASTPADAVAALSRLVRGGEGVYLGTRMTEPLAAPPLIQKTELASSASAEGPD